MLGIAIVHSSRGVVRQARPLNATAGPDRAPQRPIARLYRSARHPASVPGWVGRTWRAPSGTGAGTLPGFVRRNHLACRSRWRSRRSSHRPVAGSACRDGVRTATRRPRPQSGGERSPAPASIADPSVVWRDSLNVSLPIFPTLTSPSRGVGSSVRAGWRSPAAGQGGRRSVACAGVDDAKGRSGSGRGERCDRARPTFLPVRRARARCRRGAGFGTGPGSRRSR